jgi:hypothetical protein
LFFSYIFSIQRFNIFRTCGKDFIKKIRNKKLKLLENLPAFAEPASPKSAAGGRRLEGHPPLADWRSKQGNADDINSSFDRFFYRKFERTIWQSREKASNCWCIYQ